MKEDEFIPVSAAARHLGLSEQRIRALAAAGEIAAAKVGGRWLIRAGSLEPGRSRRVPGRPMDPCGAWGYLWILSGLSPDWLSPSTRSRLQRRRLGDEQELIARLRRRSRLQDLRVHPGMLKRLRADGRLVLSGASAPRDHSVDLLAGDEIEAYVRAVDYGDVVKRYELVEADLSNVRLRVVDDACWPFGDEMRVAPKPVVALDLLESDDPRARRAGKDLFGKSGADLGEVRDGD